MAGRTNHREYWQGFEDYLAGSSYRFPKMKARDGEFTSRTIHGPHWMLVALRNTKRDGADSDCRFIRCSIIIHAKTGPGSAKRRFDRIVEFRNEIDKKFGRRLDWDRKDDRDETQIQIWDQVDPEDKTDWPRQYQWLAERLENLFRIFPTYIDEVEAQVVD